MKRIILGTLLSATFLLSQNIELVGSGSYVIDKNHLYDKNKKKFYIERKGDLIIVTNEKDEKNGKHIIYNNIKDNQNKELVKSIKLESYKTESINIVGAGNLKIYDYSVLTNDFQLDITINGSGSLVLSPLKQYSLHNVNNLNMRIDGTGNISVSKLKTFFTRSNIRGVGNIYISDSNFNRLILSISGTGTIKGKNNKYEDLSKSVFGSGEIIGFKAWYED